MNMNAVIEKKKATPESGENLDFWSKRYVEEGHIWGDEPSMTAERLAERLNRAATVLDVGCGYGRDIVEFVQQGHTVHGIEKAVVGLSEASESIREYIDRGQAHLILGEFSRSALADDSFDAISSHRLLHLLGDNGHVRSFVNTAARVLKPGGLLYVSARDDRDFNPEQMIRRSDGQAEYKDRPGHLISFWNEARFRESFGRKFEILDFEKGTEIESKINPVDSHFTLMKARKRNEPQPV